MAGLPIFVGRHDIEWKICLGLPEVLKAINSFGSVLLLAGRPCFWIRKAHYLTYWSLPSGALTRELVTPL